MRYPWQLISIGGSIRIFLWFLFDEAKAPAFWTTLMFWILNISPACAAWTDYHAIFLRIEGLFIHLFRINYQTSS